MQEAIRTADQEIHDAQLELRLSQKQESDIHVHLKEAENVRGNILAYFTFFLISTFFTFFKFMDWYSIYQ